MRKTLTATVLSLALAVITAVAPVSAAGPSVSGTIRGLPDDTLLVSVTPVRTLQVHLPRVRFSDTVLVQEGGAFHFAPEITEMSVVKITPAGLLLRKGRQSLRPEDSSVTLFIGPGEEVEVDAALDSVSLSYTLSGTPLNEAWSRAEASLRAEKVAFAVCDRLFFRASREQVADVLIHMPYYESLDTLNARKGDYILSHPSDPLSAYLLSDLYGNMTMSPVYLRRWNEYYRKLEIPALQSVFGAMLEKRRKNMEALAENSGTDDSCFPGKPVPDFTALSTDGNRLSLSSLRGKYVLLDFWGSWCVACINGFPKLKELYEKNDGRFEILGVACHDTPEKWNAALERYRLPWKNVLDEDGAIAGAYGLGAYPTYILLDPDGRVVVFGGRLYEIHRRLALLGKQGPVRVK